MNLIQLAKEQLAALTQAAYQRVIQAGGLPDGAPYPAVEVPKERSHGDFSTTFALQAARTLKQNPRTVAQLVCEALDLTDSYFSSAAVMGAGFINVTLNDTWFDEVLCAVDDEGDDYGCVTVGAGQTVLVEFVSANPTGPMTIGNARGGVLGDALAAVLQKAGYSVSREFYLNDAGNQVEVFGRSLEARYIQHFKGEDAIEFPEDGYHGEYMKTFAADFAAIEGDKYLDTPEEIRRKALVDFGLPRNIAQMKEDLARYGITFDRWFAESELYESGYVQDTIDLLTAHGYTYEKEGALWFKATEFGLEKDDVLRKTNGFYTYYAADIAYHRNKFFVRKYDLCINILGADHHGHTLRFQAPIAALGLEPERLKFVLMQLVRLMRDGEVVRMSKRTGKAITLSDLLDEIPRDACRFFFNNRAADTHLEFDMGLAVSQESENPVHYVQYAHARIHTMLTLLQSEGTPTVGCGRAALLTHELERELIQQLALYPEEITMAARDLDPSRVNGYLVELAKCYHRFYSEIRLKGSEAPLLAARMSLCAAVKGVLHNGLALLGISAPDKM